MDPVAARAVRWGIETEYFDAFGQRRELSSAALATLLHAVDGVHLPASDISLSPVVARRGRPTCIPLPPGIDHDVEVHWEIAVGTARVVASGEARAAECVLPDTLPFGRFTLRIAIKRDSADQQLTTVLLVAPERAEQGEPERRMWALAVQLYGVRSRNNWGHGDFADLAALIELAAELGAGAIGLNPLHALFDDRPELVSPYAPNSRLFLNPLYIDIETVPGFPGLEATGLATEVERLRGSRLVDYPGVARAKLAALRLAYKRFASDADHPLRAEFEDFRRERGLPLARFASFEVLRRRLRRVWWDWPDEWRRPSAEALDALRRSDAEEVGYHEFVQWAADRQLAACQAKARRLGLPIGLYSDVAVGVDAGGADAWSEQAAILHTLSVGAPPDAFNPGGQNWGIAGYNPRGLMAEGLEPFRDMIAAAMRHAGAIRIDHVLGLNRLFLIPHGASADAGAYFRFPLEALLAVVAQESVRHRCIVVGEDLGTVPEELRGILADWGVWSYRVLLFERQQDGAFLPPEHYPAMAVATFNTHDLPTIVGWMSGHDLKVRRAVGIPVGETDAEREQSCAALYAALGRAGLDAADPFAAVVRYLAATPSRLVAVAIEDVLGVLDQPNLPSTVDEHPNWRQRLPLPLEDLGSQPRMRMLATIFAEAGRSTER